MIGKTNALAGGKLKSASGTAMLSLVNNNIYALSVNGLGFNPYVVVYGTNSLLQTYGIGPYDTGYVLFDENRETCASIKLPKNTDFDDHITAKTYAESNIIQDGFIVPEYKGSTVSTSSTYYWFALGV